MTPKFSLIIPFYNEGSKIIALLESLKALSRNSPPHEIIFVNNMSTDESPRHVAEFGFLQENARYFASSYYARNVGASCANAEYLVFIDADCVVDSSLILNYQKYIEASKNPCNTVFAGDVRPFRSSGGTDLEQYAAKRRILNQKSAITGWAYRPFAQTANAMYSRDAFLSVGGFDSRMTSGGDAEICWRMSDLLSCDYVYAQDAFVYHQHRINAQGLLAQFHKYGAGRIQQVLVSRQFSEEKQETLAVGLEVLSDMYSRVSHLELSEDDRYTLLDKLRDLSYSLGKSNELFRLLEKKSGLSGLRAVRSVLVDS